VLPRWLPSRMTHFDPGCVRTHAIGIAVIPARIWRIGGGKISRIEPCEPLMTS
jgi:hypothetical protein